MASQQLTGKGWTAVRADDGSLELSLYQQESGWNAETRITFDGTDPTAQLVWELLQSARRDMNVGVAATDPRGLAIIGVDDLDS
jgi:hypothetical protein